MRGAEQVHELTGSPQTRLLPRELRVAEEIEPSNGVFAPMASYQPAEMGGVGLLALAYPLAPPVRKVTSVCAWCVSTASPYQPRKGVAGLTESSLVARPSWLIRAGV